MMFNHVRYHNQHTGVVVSMSRKGNCYDNAAVESFFSTLKNELVHERDYHTREEAQAEVFEFIEVFYNRNDCIRHSVTSVRYSTKPRTLSPSCVSTESGVAHCDFKGSYLAIA